MDVGWIVVACTVLLVALAMWLLISDNPKDDHDESDDR